jgi:multidrug efflux pump subunit AcrA (membrane-fusion protein)
VPSNEVSLNGPFPGRVVEIRVKVGDLVRKDQVLAVLDRGPAMAATNAARAALLAAEADSTRAKEQLAIEDEAAGVAEALKGIVPPEEIRRKQRQRAIAEAAASAAGALRDVQKHSLTRAERSRRRTCCGRRSMVGWPTDSSIPARSSTRTRQCCG